MMDVNSTLIYNITTFIRPSATGVLNNTVYLEFINYITTCPISHTQATDLTTLIPVADLEIKKKTNVSSVFSGTYITYEITITNHGPSDARDVTITDTNVGFLKPEWYCLPSSNLYVICNLHSGDQ